MLGKRDLGVLQLTVRTHAGASNKIYCPRKSDLEDFRTMSIWAEGVEGDIQLEVNTITGYNCQ